jgi:hypothetical protein
LAKQDKQVSLFAQDGVRFEKSYDIPVRLPQSFEEQKATVSILFENMEKNGLGRPLPAGVMRFYERDNKQRQQFVGEVKIPDVDKNQHFESPIGKAFSISASNKVMTWESTQGRIKGELTIANGLSEAVEVNLLASPERVRVGNNYESMKWCEQVPFDEQGEIEPTLNFDFEGTGAELVSTEMEGNEICRFTILVPSDQRTVIPYQG